jgi:thiamine kinase-like enzyme
MPLIEHATWLPPADREVLLRAAHRLSPVLAELSDEQVALHGDAHPGNLLATARGPLWIDFEDACHGPREWDYATAGAANGSPYAELRSLQVALCRIATRDDLADPTDRDFGLRPFISHLTR